MRAECGQDNLRPGGFGTRRALPRGQVTRLPRTRNPPATQDESDSCRVPRALSGKSGQPIMSEPAWPGEVSEHLTGQAFHSKFLPRGTTRRAGSADENNLDARTRMPTRTVRSVRGVRSPDPSTGSGRASLTLPSLTGLRWMAAFLVFGLHLHLVAYFADGILARGLKFVFKAGSTGVSFFFVLSGFVLMWAHSKGRASRWTTFWWRRLARVYPAHLATALVALLLFAVWQPEIVPSIAPAAANLLLVHAWWPDPAFYQSLNSVSWSLACEAFFYAVFPLLVAWLTRGGRRAALLTAGGSVAALWIGPVAALWVASPDWVVWFFSWTPPGRLPEFVLGVALARLVALDAWPRRLDRLTTYPVAVTVLVAGYVAASHMPAPYRVAGCTAIGFGLLIVAAARGDLRDDPSLWRRPAAVRLGELSYAFYLVHMIVVFVLALAVGQHPRLDAGWGILLAMATLLLALASAWVLHECVERPARTLLLRLPTALTRRPVLGRRPEVPRQRR